MDLDADFADYARYAWGDGTTHALLDCTHVAIPRADLGLGTMAVVCFDAATPDEPRAFGLTGLTTAIYESIDYLYLAAAPDFAGSCLCRLGFATDALVAPADGGTTYLYDFELAGTGATCAAAGEVDGIVEDRWSMDEHDGGLRVGSGRPSAPGTSPRW